MEIGYGMGGTSIMGVDGGARSSIQLLLCDHPFHQPVGAGVPKHTVLSPFPTAPSLGGLIMSWFHTNYVCR